tara:strand:+ start:42 stop:269 length:228 start_codon:yes stop_codon:yes gene_type:complete
MKVWLLVLFLHTPQMPSVKYEASIYSTEDYCIQAQLKFLNFYSTKPKEYQDGVKVDAHCLPFDSFPIPKFLNSNV